MTVFLLDLFAAIGALCTLWFTWVYVQLSQEKKKEDRMIGSAVFAQFGCGVCRVQSDKKIGFPYDISLDKNFTEKHRACRNARD